MPPLFIFFLGTLKATAFLIQQPPNIAGWLWKKTQAVQKQKIFFWSTVK
jgi:hypothetical protein